MNQLAPADLLVIGAGPCGLAAALHARGQGLNVQLFEAEAEAGGRARSFAVECEGESFVMERGPIGWVGDTPELDGACQALGLQPIESKAADSHRYLVDGDTLVPIPQDGKKLASISLLSVRERMRAGAEKWSDFGDETQEETVFELVARRFGDGFANKVAAPAVRGLWGDDARAASVRELLPGLHRVEYEFGSLTKAMQQNPQVFGQKTKSFRHGVGELTQAMATQVADSLRLSSRIDGVIRESGWWYLYQGETCVAVGQQLAVCLPPEQAALVLREVVPNAELQLGRFKGSDLATVSLLYREDEVRDPCAGHGVLAPSDGKNPVASVAFMHSIFPQQVPDGWLHIRGMLCADVDPGLLQRSDEELVAILERSLQSWVGTPTQGARAHFVQRIPGGVPHYALGRANRLAELEADLRVVPSLHLGGDAWFGIGIEPALLRGANIAKAVREQLAASATSN